jgi:DnaJ-class molecular chaperone
MDIEPIPIPISSVIKKICSNCAGTGKIIQSPFQWVDVNGNPVTTTEIDCPVCQGTGKIVWGEIVSE